MKKRLPLIFMCWMIIMVINFIYVRISAFGYNLLSMPASSGASIAARYNSSFVWMIISACAFAAVTVWRMKTRRKDRKKQLPAHTED